MISLPFSSRNYQVYWDLNLSSSSNCFQYSYLGHAFVICILYLRFCDIKSTYLFLKCPVKFADLCPSLHWSSLIKTAIFISNYNYPIWKDISIQTGRVCKQFATDLVSLIATYFVSFFKFQKLLSYNIGS